MKLLEEMEIAGNGIPPGGCNWASEVETCRKYGLKVGIGFRVQVWTRSNKAAQSGCDI